jgi:hypothetical protein
MGCSRITVAVLALAAVSVAGCGGERIITQTVTHTVTTPPASEVSAKGPTLARQPAGPGEVVLTGDSAPKTLGPIDLEPGIYKFRFEQFAPDSPGLDFRTQASPIAVMLNRKPRVTAADSQLIINLAARSGENIVNATGKYYVDVTSADHSYVLRFTPER